MHKLTWKCLGYLSCARAQHWGLRTGWDIISIVKSHSNAPACLPAYLPGEMITKYSEHKTNERKIVGGTSGRTVQMGILGIHSLHFTHYWRARIPSGGFWRPLWGWEAKPGMLHVLWGPYLLCLSQTWVVGSWTGRKHYPLCSRNKGFASKLGTHTFQNVLFWQVPWGFCLSDVSTKTWHKLEAPGIELTWLPLSASESSPRPLRKVLFMCFN